jgi:hypothetical protein
LAAAENGIEAAAAATAFNTRCVRERGDRQNRHLVLLLFLLIAKKKKKILRRRFYHATRDAANRLQLESPEISFPAICAAVDD